jgi:hypothetical protein
MIFFQAALSLFSEIDFADFLQWVLAFTFGGTLGLGLRLDAPHPRSLLGIG